MTAGSIVLAYNLEGVTELKLSRAAYAGIFLGKVKKWNDPLIAKANPGVKLPDEPSMSLCEPIAAVRPSSSPSTSAPSVRNLPRAPAQQYAQLAGGNAFQGQRRRHRQHQDHAGLHRLHRIRVRQKPEFAYGRSRTSRETSLRPTTASGQAALASAQLPEDLIVWASDPEAKEAIPSSPIPGCSATSSTRTKRSSKFFKSLLSTA